MTKIDWPEVGRRISLLRQRKELSVREVARRADIDKNTYLRLERGLAVRMATLQSVCTALGTTPGRQFAALGEPHETFRVSRASGRKWEKDPLLMSRTDPAKDFAQIDSTDRRWPLGWKEGHFGFNGFLDCELHGGSVVSSLIELFRRSTLRSFPGEELVFCVRGSVILQVGEESTLLEEGDAACLWAGTPHWCSPVETVEWGQSPPLILSVRVEGPPGGRRPLVATQTPADK